MSQVTVKVEFDQLNGTAKFSLDLQGESELEHELLAAAIGSGRSVSITPAHVANELFAEFTIHDISIWPKAVRALENRRRVRDGKPTIEEEEAAAAQAKANAEQAEKDATVAEANAKKDKDAAQQKEDDRLANVLRTALGK